MLSPKLLERSIKVEIPIKNGQPKVITVRAWIDYFYPCNLFSREIAAQYPGLEYESTDSRYYDQKLAGPASSTGRFYARWFCDDIDAFDPTCQLEKFESSIVTFVVMPSLVVLLF